MTRDFAKKRPAAQGRPRRKSRAPGWVWLFTGAVLGGFIVFLVNLAKVELPEQAAPKELALPEASPEREPDTPKPRFDFYKLLRESETIAPATQATDGSGAQQSAEPAQEFILQVGSFRRAQDADGLRAQLLLLNLDAYTEQVELRNQETWHRVMVGPFENHSRMSSARSTLVSNNYNALVLKRKREP